MQSAASASVGTLAARAPQSARRGGGWGRSAGRLRAGTWCCAARMEAAAHKLLTSIRGPPCAHAREHAEVALWRRRQHAVAADSHGGVASATFGARNGPQCSKDDLRCRTAALYRPDTRTRLWIQMCASWRERAALAATCKVERRKQVRNCEQTLRACTAQRLTANAGASNASCVPLPIAQGVREPCTGAACTRLTHGARPMVLKI